MAQPYTQLRIRSLKWISAVDRGAQGPVSDVAILKRAPTGDSVEGVCKVAGLDEKLGLVFGWALATSLDGGKTPHVDLQNDAIIGGDDLIRVAAEFMEKAAASDILHSGEQDGRIVFALPLTADIKSALKIQSDIEGLAIAMKPSPETFKRFVSKELNAFSIGGEGERTQVGKAADPIPVEPAITPTVDKAKAKKKPKKGMKPGAAATPPDTDGMSYKRVGKMAVFTTETDGHVHSVSLEDPARCWSDQLMTSYQTSDGADTGHCHPWVYDPATGAITIGMDSGHDHKCTAVVPADVLAEAAADDDDDKSDGACLPCADSPSGKVLVTVQARAPKTAQKSDSTQLSVIPTVEPQEPGMTTEAETIASLRKMLSASLALTEPQRLYLTKQALPDVEAFLAMDGTARENVIKSADAADPEVYKTDGGMSIRKSHGSVAEQMARQLDAQSKISKAHEAELTIQKAAVEQANFEKRAGVDLSHFTKALPTRAAIVKAIDSIADEKVRGEAHEALKGANFALAKLGIPTGADDHKGPGPDDPQAQLEVLVKQHATDNKIPATQIAKAWDAVLQTPEGAALYEAADKRSKTQLRSV